MRRGVHSFAADKVRRRVVLGVSWPHALSRVWFGGGGGPEINYLANESPVGIVVAMTDPGDRVPKTVAQTPSGGRHGPSSDEPRRAVGQRC